ncbi:MAG: cobalamin B12-binding domain-containing protein [Candidatus Aenigmarchaeota archaeon]|nr:cobalamin B12-binding domain-containing protein [Candidatus Aenigmarchaeota archaeon]
MRVLLISPPQTLKERYAHNVGDVGGFLPPLGLCYMAAVLERAGHEVRIMDCPVNNYVAGEILTEIESFKPELVGIAAITSLASVTIELTDLIKRQYPEVTVLLGGPHATITADELAEKTAADIIVREEADNVITDIVDDLEKYKQIKVVEAGKVKDLDSLPFPARHLLGNLNKYSSLPNTYKKDPHCFQMVTSRGCPFTCTFCFDAKGFFRQRSVKNVMEEIRSLKGKYNIKEIAFWDDILTLNKKWVYDFCAEMGKENIVWSCYTRLDLIDENLLKAMKNAGCWNIFFGIESGAQELLDNITKKMTVEQMRNAVKIVKKAGIEIRGSFMLGLPGETPELARQTIKFAIDLDPDYAQFSLTTPYPGTQLWNTYEQWGTLDKNALDEYHGWSPVFVPHGYNSKDELMAMHKEAFKKFYMRPKYIIRRISKIRSVNDLKRNMKGMKVVKAFT